MEVIMTLVTEGSVQCGYNQPKARKRHAHYMTFSRVCQATGMKGVSATSPHKMCCLWSSTFTHCSTETTVIESPDNSCLCIRAYLWAQVQPQQHISVYLIKSSPAHAQCFCPPPHNRGWKQSERFQMHCLQCQGHSELLCMKASRVIFGEGSSEDNSAIIGSTCFSCWSQVTVLHTCECLSSN